MLFGDAPMLPRSLVEMWARMLRGARRRGRGSRPEREGRRQAPLTFERLEERILLSAPHPLDLSTLAGTNGLRLDGVAGGDHSGFSVRGAGDVNGDGFEDRRIGVDRVALGVDESVRGAASTGSG